ncbi:Hypothetical predicted protein [Olea europaea subsp. europaea]|uniref:Uncharacterized protein n=1 Tax=Olea europaea subsp. europaea TaxID=158383 RepID=A0A8S0UR69_OLEEU|nr:Hypothetical predicted protein [Olea europaea subsp. europaea]
MRKLLRLMQSQLARSSQNKEVNSLEIGVNVHTITNYDTDQISQEASVLVEGNRANAPRRQTSVFGRLGPTRDREGRPLILPTQIELPLISSNRPHLFNSFSKENQHGQPQPRIADELVLRYMHSPARNRQERRAALAWM